jgi:manganese/zinc/iron transport system permease protein
MTAEDRRVWLIIIGLVVLFILHIPLSVILFDVTYDYTLVTVAAGGAVLGLISGVLGSFAVLRQQSLLGDALSHAALPGVAIAFLMFGRDLGWLLLGAGMASWLAVLFINAITRTTRIKQDAAMGMTLTAFFAVGLALLTYIQSRPDASQAGLDQFIFGQAAAIVQQDVLLISVVGVIAFVLLGLFWKEFTLITFDMQFARANGFPVRLLDGLLSTLIVVAIVLGLQLAGVILMVGLLIAPAVAARQWTRHLGQMVALSAAFGAFAGASGAIFSAIAEGLPTGPLIIIVAFITVFLSLTFSPERGLLWQLWRQRTDRRRFAAKNVMRDIYRHALRHNDPAYPAPEGMLVTMRGGIVRIGLHRLSEQGLAFNAPSTERNERCWALTPDGIAQAARDEHNQRLWATYRRCREDLHLPIIVEDHQRNIADLLPPHAVEQLESLMDRER